MEKTKADSATPLDDISATSLNVKNACSQTSKKRKRDTDNKNCESEPSQCYFLTSALSTRPARQSPTFAVVAVLSRADLPLTWLNTRLETAALPPGFLFKASLPSIQQWDRQVLIARLCPNGGLFAVERAAADSFVAFALQNWVSQEHCEAAALGNTYLPDIQTLLDCQGQSDAPQDELSVKPLLDVPKIRPTSDPKVPKNRKGALARMSIMTSKKDVALGSNEALLVQSEPTTLDDCGVDNLEAQKCSAVETTHHADEPSVLQERPGPESLHGEKKPNSATTKAQVAPATEAFLTPEKLTTDHLHRQYLETLYLSKISLAFYAKGPLSRARAQAQTDAAETSSKALHEFYLQIVVPIKKMDAKYKDSLARVILSSRDKLEAMADENPKDGCKKPRKAKKKIKLGKDGLWSDEEEYLLRCWNSRELTPSSVVSQDSQGDDLRRHISDLRIRETEMQLLIMLEILCLQNVLSKASTVAQDATDPDIKVESTERDMASISTKVPKTKKPQDLNSDIDTVVDRLCIWHTVAVDEWFTSPLKADHRDPSLQLKDKLRDFCAEVIVPFYASKLPEQCKSICQKLGGPEISPQRPKSQPKRPKSSLRRAPSASSKTADRLMNRRTLERVLSEDQSTRHASPPVLSRSSTAPLASNSKREPSERPKSRGGMHKSVSFTNREIDLVADARVQEVKQRKLKQLTAQKRELQSAIDGLKKPNRVSMAKSFMDDIERRNVDKEKVVQQVQIMATPRKNKHPYNILGINDTNSLSVPQNHIHEDRTIPSSTAKPDLHSINNMPRSSTMKRAVLTAIHETPSKNASKTRSPIEQTSTSSPLPKPFLSQRMLHHQQQPSSQIPSTPLKLKNRIANHDIPETAGKAMDRVMGFPSSGDRTDGKSDMNIYERLGWWDDDDL